jgi:signal peptidase I
MTKLPKIAKAACAIAFVIAALEFFAAFWIGPILMALLAMIPLLAGIGIVRGRVWSAYGFAVFLGLSLILFPIVLSRSSGAGARNPMQILASGAFELALVVLFFLAGRSLRIAGAKTGHAFPWIAVSILVTLPLALLEPFVMPSNSMAKTLLIGDRFLVRIWPKPTPARGDIIAFYYPINRHDTYIKRVIGVPGDRIRISNKIVYLNGAPLQEPYAIHESHFVDTYRDNFPAQPNIQLPPAAQSMLHQDVVNGELVVPEGNYFVLGDNRDDSSDSRYWGFVATGDLIGKPLIIYDSHELTDQDALLAMPLAKAKVRWSRLFKML